MPIPDFIVALRRTIGHDLLWLPGVTAVVVDATRLLLVRRADTGAWTSVSGILDPGEQPALGAVREVEEETGVTVEVERLASVVAGAPITYPNGDRAQFLDLTFRCRYVSGTARVGDDESLEVGWFDLDDLPPMPPHQLSRIDAALAEDGLPHFVS